MRTGRAQRGNSARDQLPLLALLKVHRVQIENHAPSAVDGKVADELEPRHSGTDCEARKESTRNPRSQRASIVRIKRNHAWGQLGREQDASRIHARGNAKHACPLDATLRRRHRLWHLRKLEGTQHRVMPRRQGGIRGSLIEAHTRHSQPDVQNLARCIRTQKRAQGRRQQVIDTRSCRHVSVVDLQHLPHLRKRILASVGVPARTKLAATALMKHRAVRVASTQSTVGANTRVPLQPPSASRKGHIYKQRMGRREVDPMPIVRAQPGPDRRDSCAFQHFRRSQGRVSRRLRVERHTIADVRCMVERQIFEQTVALRTDTFRFVLALQMPQCRLWRARWGADRRHMIAARRVVRNRTCPYSRRESVATRHRHTRTPLRICEIRQVLEPTNSIRECVRPINASTIQIHARAALRMSARRAKGKQDNSLWITRSQHTNGATVPIQQALKVATLLRKVCDRRHEPQRPKSTVLTAHLSDHAIDGPTVAQPSPRQTAVKQQGRERRIGQTTHKKGRVLVKAWKAVQCRTRHIDASALVDRVGGQNPCQMWARHRSTKPAPRARLLVCHNPSAPQRSLADTGRRDVMYARPRACDARQTALVIPVGLTKSMQFLQPTSAHQAPIGDSLPAIQIPNRTRTPHPSEKAKLGPELVAKQWPLPNSRRGNPDKTGLCHCVLPIGLQGCDTGQGKGQRLERAFADEVIRNLLYPPAEGCDTLAVHIGLCRDLFRVRVAHLGQRQGSKSSEWRLDLQDRVQRCILHLTRALRWKSHRECCRGRW